MAVRKRLVHGSLFSGIGGFDLAAQWCGWKNAFHCEINEFCARILQYYWPAATLIKNINGYDWKKWKGKIDVLSGGFPCQPFSLAGKRRGTADERHLWPAMLNAIRGIKPTWLVAENVRGIASWNAGLVFEQVCLDLENEGYQIQTFIIPAAGIGAPHRRERVFFIAYAGGKGRYPEAELFRQKCRQVWEQIWDKSLPDGICRPIANTNDDGWFRKGQAAKNENGLQESGVPGQLAWQPQGLCFPGDAANAYGSKRCKRGIQPQEFQKAEQYARSFHTWRDGRAWAHFPTQYPICRRDDGISGMLDTVTFSRWRSQSLQAFGNAVVPQVIYQVFQCIVKMEHLFKVQ